MAGDSRTVDGALAKARGDCRIDPAAALLDCGVWLRRVWTPNRASVLLIVVTGLLYAQTIAFPLVYEDLTDPTTVFREWSWPGWHRLLTILSMRVSILLSGMEAWGFHLVSVSLHVLNGLLLWRLVSGWAGVFALGLFLLHPLQVESVAYVSSRSDLLLTTCVLLAVLATDRRQWGWALAACLGAVLAKESGVMAIPLIVAWSVFRGALLPIWLYLVPLPALTLVAWKFADLWTVDALYTASETVKAWWLLSRIFVPIGLSIDHDWGWITPDIGLMALGATSIVCAALGLGKTPRMAFIATWIALALTPRLLMPLVEGLHEHHFALPMAGLALGIGASLQKDDV